MTILDTHAWIKQALALPKIEPVPLDPEVAVKAAAFENSFPGDPADRLIVATAIIRKASLISKDQLIKKAKVVPVVW